MVRGHGKLCQVPTCRDRTRVHTGSQSGGCGHRLPAERRPPRLWGSTQHPVQAGGQGGLSKPCRGEPARGHPTIAPAVAESQERPMAQAVVMEGWGLAALWPQGACCQLATMAAPSGSTIRQRVREPGASRGCSVGEPGLLGAVARMQRASERVLASNCEVQGGLAMVHANGRGLRAVTTQLGTVG